jgi:hypothetical protein
MTIDYTPVHLSKVPVAIGDPSENLARAKCQYFNLHLKGAR